MKHLLPLIFIALSIQGYAKDKFVLKGDIPASYNNQTVSLYLLPLSSEDKFVAETTIKNGQFILNGICYPKERAEIRIGNNQFPIFLEEGEIFFKQDSVSTIGGTPLNQLYQSYRDSIRYFDKQIDILLPWIPAGNGAYKDLKYGSPAHAMYIRYGQFLMNFKRDNISNAVGKQAVLDALRSNSELEAESMRPGGKSPIDSTFQRILAMCDADFKKHPQFTAFQELIDRREKDQKEQNRLVGTQYIDFKLQTMDGKEVSLSDYVGKSKLLLIDFWASWCGACIANLPELKKAYEQYHSQGLNIISISLDTNAKNWKAAAEKHKMPWPQISDLKGKESDLAKAYDANAGIPRIIIMDEQGKILHYGFGGPVQIYIDVAFSQIKKAD